MSHPDPGFDEVDYIESLQDRVIDAFSEYVSNPKRQVEELEMLYDAYCGDVEQYKENFSWEGGLNE